MYLYNIYMATTAACGCLLMNHVSNSTMKRIVVIILIDNNNTKHMHALTHTHTRSICMHTLTLTHSQTHRKRTKSFISV